MRKFHKKKPARSNAKTSNNSTTKLWIWGTHAANAALMNPKRIIHQVAATRNAFAQLPQNRVQSGAKPLDPHRITELLPAGAVHQGLAVQIEPLATISLEQILTKITGPLIILDGISDPRNIGAIFRSAAAFGASAIIAQDRHMPPLTGVLAKAAVGAVETVPFIPVVNLSRTLEKLTDAGIKTIGLAGETELTIAQAIGKRPIALVMGAEGKGMRPNVKKHCEVLAKIPINAKMESLNVASAASIALYEIMRTI